MGTALHDDLWLGTVHGRRGGHPAARGMVPDRGGVGGWAPGCRGARPAGAVEVDTDLAGQLVSLVPGKPVLFDDVQAYLVKIDSARVAMTPEDLARAGLEALGKKWA